MFKLTIMYKLLTYHMNPNPNYLFGHAEISGMLANNDSKVSTYEGYVKECDMRDVSSYSRECYDQFMTDCKRVDKPDLNADYWLRVKPDVGNCM